MVPSPIHRLVILLAAVLLAGAMPGGESVLQLSDTFRRIQAPGTGRAAIQLTSGTATHYPLYYFIPTITADGRYLVHHRYEQGEVQLWRLDLQSGRSDPLTRATGTSTDWHPWQNEKDLRGVMDFRAVLDAVHGTVVYFDGNAAHAVDVATLKDEVLFTLPEDREPIGQNCVTPDGAWFIYIDAPRGSIYRKPCTGARVAGWNLATREQRTLCTVDAPIHHVLPWHDSRHVVINHPFDHMGMIWASLDGGPTSELRRGDPGATGEVCHQAVTRAGLLYEAYGAPRVMAGLYDPIARTRIQFPLPSEFGYTHTGADPDGRLWFYETRGRTHGHSLWLLERFGRDLPGGDLPTTATNGVGTWKRLTGDWATYSPEQRGHFHPQVTPDRRWIMFTGGDPATRTDQIMLLDIRDCADTAGIDVAMLSPTGANDIPCPPNEKPTP